MNDVGHDLSYNTGNGFMSCHGHGWESVFFVFVCCRCLVKKM